MGAGQWQQPHGLSGCLGELRIQLSKFEIHCLESGHATQSHSLDVFVVWFLCSCSKECFDAMVRRASMERKLTFAASPSGHSLTASYEAETFFKDAPLV
jgi:hypothetical protein